MEYLGKEMELQKRKSIRRGFDDKDQLWFSDKAITTLKAAQEEIIWLLDRNYKISPVLELTGGHYQLSARQRMALQRACCSSKQKRERQTKLLSAQEGSKDCLYIDGFNLIITLEVALSGSVLIRGYDGCIRDMAGLRGTYRLIDKTDLALQLIGKALHELRIPSVKIFLDAPVSNSGRLRGLILAYAEDWDIPVEVELVTNPDKQLSQMERIITADSVILDSCISWFNLGRKIIEDHIKTANIVDLSRDSF